MSRSRRVVRDDGVIFDTVRLAAQDARVRHNNMSPIVKHQIRVSNGHRYRYEDTPVDNKTRYTVYRSKKLIDGTYKEQIVAVGTPSRIKEILNISEESLGQVFGGTRKNWRAERIMTELMIK